MCKPGAKMQGKKDAVTAATWVQTSNLSIHNLEMQHQMTILFAHHYHQLSIATNQPDSPCTVAGRMGGSCVTTPTGSAPRRCRQRKWEAACLRMGTSPGRDLRPPRQPLARQAGSAPCPHSHRPGRRFAALASCWS